MTSEDDECFVYITLPGQISAVTAGKYKIISSPTGEAKGEFFYGLRYLERKDVLPIDPVELGTLNNKVFSTVRSGGLFGALRDACPDSWGRRVIEKCLGSPGSERPEIDYMLNSPDDRAGAIGFGLGVRPPAPVRIFNRTLELRKLMDMADQVIASEDDPSHAIRLADEDHRADLEQADQLINAGTSMGGARPKATVEDQGALWVAKFPQENKDKWNNPRVEHAMMQLARTCGISSAETKIVTVAGRDVLLVKRFDREQAENGYTRIRMISGLTLLGIEEGERNDWSYLRLAEEVQRRAASGQDKQLAEMYRRMTFNALISNTDDHPRNHAFLGHGSSWDLSPAYDLTPTPSVSHTRRLAMACGTDGRNATRKNLLSAHAKFRLSQAQAEGIVDDMAAAVQATWYQTVRAAGVTEVDADKINSAFVCEGFGARLHDIAEESDDDASASWRA